MELKGPLSFNEQVKRLKKHNMSVDNELDALLFLQHVSYYRFTGYALQFRISPNNSDYIDGTTFDAIKSICLFDEKLRDILRGYIEKAEIYYRCQIAHGFAMNKCVEPPHDQHYDVNNYYNKKAFNELISKFNANQSNYYNETLISKHHMSKYGNKYPLWVMTEMLSFSDISKLYSSMFFSEKDVIAKSIGVGRSVLESHLHVLSILRNKCAHAARLYNNEYNPPPKLTDDFLRRNPEVKLNTLFAYVLVLVKRLPLEQDKVSLIDELDQLLEEFRGKIDLSMIGFPENGIRILRKNMKY